MSDTWTIEIPDYKPRKLVEKVREPKTPKSHLLGFIKDYHKLYNAVKLMDESDGGIYSLGYAAGDLYFHCSEGTARREHAIYRNVLDTYKAFLNALEDALGVESKYREWVDED